jgi:hypothetical protein
MISSYDYRAAPAGTRSIAWKISWGIVRIRSTFSTSSGAHVLRKIDSCWAVEKGRFEDRLPFNDRHRMRTAPFFAVAAAMLLLKGCGEVPSHDAPPVAIALLPAGAGSEAALLDGVLQVVGNCLYVEAMDGTRVLPAFMTKDTQWRADWGALWIGEEVFRPGQKVQLGGSALSASPGKLTWPNTPSAGCDTSRIWATGSVRAAG